MEFVNKRRRIRRGEGGDLDISMEFRTLWTGLEPDWEAHFFFRTARCKLPRCLAARPVLRVIEHTKEITKEPLSLSRRPTSTAPCIPIRGTLSHLECFLKSNTRWKTGVFVVLFATGLFCVV
jgi:hypothetical protein